MGKHGGHLGIGLGIRIREQNTANNVPPLLWARRVIFSGVYLKIFYGV